MKTIQDYPIQTVTPTAADIMWIFSGKWSLLDNFALLPIRYAGKVWPTSEHAFAAMKSADPKMQARIRKLPDPGRAKSSGRLCHIRSNWEDVKFQTMWEILRAKFNQHPAAREVLLSTGVRPIYEGNTWEDDIWGVVPTGAAYSNEWTGRNALGEMLMEIRIQIQNGEKLL